MPRAVRFDQYGGIDVLEVVDVDPPVPGPGQLLVRVKAAGINPGEAKIREGALHDRWPATFPSGQGSDLAGVVEQLGEHTDAFAVGDEVIGFTDDRASQAELVLVEARNVTRRPPGVSWEAAGVAVRRRNDGLRSGSRGFPGAGDTLVVAGAAGGVGSLAVQLAKRTGATVIGLASERNHDWLMEHGVIRVSYGDGVADRIRAAAAGKIDAFIDTAGGYVELALELGVRSRAHRHDRRLPGRREVRASRPTGPPRRRAPRSSPSSRADRPGRARGPDRPRLSARAGARRVRRARAGPHARQDRARAIARAAAASGG